jgi:hypothetical protein
MKITLLTQSDAAKSLAAATPTDILPADGWDISQIDRVTIFLSNTGANAVTATTLTFTIGGIAITDTTSIGTINAGTTKTFSLAPGSTDPAYQNLKLSAESTSGTTLKVEAIAVAHT